MEDWQARAMQWLIRREHSQEELKHKLQHAGCDASLADEILVKLRSTGLQSDERYAEMYVRSRHERGYGPVRIAHDLAQKGLSQTLIEQIVYSQEIDWFATAKRVQQKKFGHALPENPSAQMKQKKFLQYRGFSYEQINEAISTMID